jgi:ABC-type sugar transport system ATPase subunit
MAEIELTEITKTFGSFHAVKKVSLRFPAHTTTCLLGPSGCGKTTLLRMIAGLEMPTSGSIRIAGRDVTECPARRRDIAMVFQYPVIYRGLSVFDNIALPLREQKLSTQELKTRVGDAIACQSAIILFDEPITNVDPESKFRLKQDLKKITERLRQTIVYVTHDQNEAMTLADQIVLLRDGEVLQQDAPRQIYNHPQQRFGGWFLGSPGMSFLEHAFDPTERGRLQSDLFPFPVKILDSTAGIAKSTLRVGIRPELLRLSAVPIADGVKGTVKRKFRGVAGQFLVAIQLSKHLVWAKVGSEVGKRLGEHVWVQCDPDAVTIFDDHEQALSSRLVRIED